MYELKCTECGIEGYSDEASSIVCQPCHKKTEALAASRLELIKEVDKQLKICPICHGILTWIGDVEPINAGHTNDCKWAKELADD